MKLPSAVPEIVLLTANIYRKILHDCLLHLKTTAMVSTAGNPTQSPYENIPNSIKSRNINRVDLDIIKACSAGINKRKVAAQAKNLCCCWQLR